MWMVLLGWVLFATTHIGLTVPRVRAFVVVRWGERAFLWMFVAIASVLFTILSVTYASVPNDDPVPWSTDKGMRSIAIASIVLGVMMMTSALAPKAYWDSPTAVLSTDVRPPFGLERITRHPFFTGLVMLTASHLVLATRWSSIVFFSGFTVLIVCGAWHQGRKLRARKGEAFERYLARTSAIPFVAILRGRQTLPPAREVPWTFATIGLILAFGLRAIHEHIFAYRGLGFAAAVVVGSIAIGVISDRQATPPRAHEARP